MTRRSRHGAFLLPVFLASVTVAQSAPLITTNNAAGADGSPLGTYDFAGGALVNSFTPDGGTGFTNNGRGVAVAGNEIFYTDVAGFSSPSPTDAIRVAPYNNGAGGADIRALPNPDPATGVQDLAIFGGSLYVMTGYQDQSLQVFKLDPSAGTVLGSPVTINGGQSSSDGFTLLPNGNFLINDGDADSTYREYDAITGNPTGFSIVVPHASTSTGVDIDLAGQRLYFAADFNHIVETDLAGNFVADQSVSPLGLAKFEDIALPQPVPAPGGLSLAAASLASLPFFSRRRRLPAAS